MCSKVIHVCFDNNKWSILGRWIVTPESVTECDVDDYTHLYTLYLNQNNKKQTIGSIDYDGNTTIKLQNIMMAQNIFGVPDITKKVYLDFVSRTPTNGIFYQLYTDYIGNITIENNILSFRGEVALYGTQHCNNDRVIVFGLDVPIFEKCYDPLHLKLNVNLDNNSSFTFGEISNNNIKFYYDDMEVTSFIEKDETGELIVE